MNAVVADMLLDQLLTTPSGGAGGGEALPAAVRQPPKQAIAKVNYAHDGMIDLILANPAISQNEIARRLNYSVSWVSQVVCSDAFQARLAERRDEVVDPILRATLEEQFKGMLARSLDILRVKLEREPGEIPDQLALRTLELSSRALGYGARVPSVQVNINAGERLEALGSNLEQLLIRKRASAGASYVEGEVTERLDQASQPAPGGAGSQAG